MESKFKTGDIVRVLDGRNIVNYTYGWTDNMNELVGKYGKIRNVISHSDHRFGYLIDFYQKYPPFSDSGIAIHNVFDERGLEKYRPIRIVISQDDENPMIFNAQIKDEHGLNHIYLQVARCHENDSFDPEIGERLALMRIQEASRKKPYNGKIICVDKHGSWSFQVGKVYKVVNGKVMNDCGNFWNSKEELAYSLEDINNKIMVSPSICGYVKFIEYKGEV